jgi:hypothetical protein
VELFVPWDFPRFVAQVEADISEAPVKELNHVILNRVQTINAWHFVDVGLVA